MNYDLMRDYRADMDMRIDFFLGLSEGGKFHDLPQNGNDAANILMRRHYDTMMLSVNTYIDATIMTQRAMLDA